MKPGNVLVIGGGIAGMSAAILLAGKGYSIDLVERDPDWQAAGAGISINAATLRAFGEVGVLDRILEAGFFARKSRFVMADGTVVGERPGMQIEGTDLPSSGGIMRPVLNAILADATRTAGVNVRLGCTFETICDRAGKALVALSDGTEASYDLVIGADGLHSNARATLFPDAPKPEFTGQGCWRMVAPRPAEIECFNFIQGGAVPCGITAVSKDEIYLWVLEHAPDNPWVEDADKPTLLRNLLEGFGGTVAALRESIGSDSQIMYRPLEAILLPPPWGQGRVILIGDAAHATTPHLASGAGMAVEDAVVLAELIDDAADVPALAAALVERRLSRCRMVVENSIAIGKSEMEPGVHGDVKSIMFESWRKLAQPF